LLKNFNWKKYEHTFLIACLLHDCGHAPFSHIFQGCYNRCDKAKELLLKLACREFRRDYEYVEPQSHEIVSAVILLKKFAGVMKGRRFDGVEADSMLAVRMITGCIHAPADTKKKQVENCLVRLLNGPAIDVDKLDYAIRDSWASGVDNIRIDVRRLLSGLEIVPRAGTLVLAFHKSALSVVENVAVQRNYLYTWVYKHHTVCYHQRLLTKTIDSLARVVFSRSPHRFLDRLFSIEALLQPVKLKHDIVYLPTDGDLIHLVKKYKDRIAESKEFLSRQPESVPLWKTFAEYDHFFKDVSEKTRLRIYNSAERILSARQGTALARKFFVLDAEPELARIRNAELFIVIDGDTVSYTDIFREDRATDKCFFYCFIPKEFKNKKKLFLKKLQDLAR